MKPEQTLDTSYHNASFDKEKRKETIGDVVRAVSQFPQDVSLVFRGISGMAIGFAVADRTEREFAVVRKSPSESSNASRMVEGYRCEQYVIIDDLIDTGTTICAILEQMTKDRPGSKCVGIVLYASSYSKHYFEDNEIRIPILSSGNQFKL